MAESASAAAPSGGPGAKSSSSSGTWWKSLATRKKSKEGPVGSAPAPAWPPAAEPSEMLPAPPRASDSPENQALGSGGGGSRRNLKISRSGRFKEKRKVRTALLPESPQKLFEGGGAGGPAGGNAAAAPPSEETPCQ